MAVGGNWHSGEAMAVGGNRLQAWEHGVPADNVAGLRILQPVSMARSSVGAEGWPYYCWKVDVDHVVVRTGLGTYTMLVPPTI